MFFINPYGVGKTNEMKLCGEGKGAELTECWLGLSEDHIVR